MTLTPEQQAFAKEHHGLLIAFMRRYGLDDEQYGRFAERYVKTVARYCLDVKLRAYAFSTVLWYHLRSELYNVNRQDLPYETCSYEALPHELPAEDTAPFSDELWERIEQVLTKKQMEAIFLRNQSYTNREIGQICGTTMKAIEKRFNRIRKRIRIFLDNEKEYMK